PERIAASAMTRFAAEVATRHGVPLRDYAELHRWSVEQREDFWAALWDFCEVVGERGERICDAADVMPGARWFSQARLNFAENLLRRRDGTDAIVFRGEDRVERRLSFGEVHAQVACCAAALRAAGIGPG